MALKADRQVDSVELGYFFPNVAERGVTLVVSTGGSGVAMDSTKNVAAIVASPSGQFPLGILLSDFVSIDRTRQPLNWHKDQQASGDKACILTKGWCVTDQLLGTVGAGQWAYLAESGKLRATNPNTITNTVNSPFVGRFRSGKDENGFAKLYVEL